MKYDFDTVINRRGTDSVKWNVGKNELPMWVADMDFRLAPEIEKAIKKRMDHGVFGYSVIPDEWYEAYMNWWRERHNFKMKKEGLVFCTGVVPAISSIVRKLTTPNENVVIQTPVYNVFFNSVLNNGCRVFESPLIYKNGRYSMDFGDLEKKLSDPQTTLMILCNPQNPAGKIWDKKTLEKVGDLAKKHGVTVVSDEIHCDITEPGKNYVPFASVSEVCREISVSCIAPTKAFNMAGMKSAAVYAENPLLRHKVWRALNTDEIAEPNSFACIAAIAAFSEGGEWLDALRGYISGNRKRVYEFVKNEIPEISVVKSDATYLLWLDISKTGMESTEAAAKIREKTGLFLTAGSIYGEAGRYFLRMNIACPKTLLEDGLNRLKKGIKNLH
ncbi:pyridoxal phosphate-dependent aminotransferase [bacterium]|nr:pyridoxal phosphate-dependent aminotransferase [bacterium]